MKKAYIIAIGIVILVAVLFAVVLFKPKQGQEYHYEEPTIDELAAEGESNANDEELLARIQEANPLIKHLPFKSEGGKFEVYYGIENAEALKVFYVVTMYPKSSPGGSFYEDEISKIKSDANLWLQRNLVPTLPEGTSLKNVTIRWKLAGN
jgi:hypothetical protein